MKRRIKELAILGGVLALVGLAVLVSGVVPVKASSGHWPVTRWVLDFASDRSVATHSYGIDVPSLDEPAMVTLGASIYETNCRFCHGRPGESRPPVASGLTPQPPLLAATVAGKQPEELFYIVKHGIKFAGMPAWPTQLRDEEIWPVVAFLQNLPTMPQATYMGHVQPSLSMPTDPPAVATLARTRCAPCHGIDGNGRAGQRVPMLAGQREAYLRESLLAYRNAQRPSGVMMPVAHELSDPQVNQLAAYFSQQPRRPVTPLGTIDPQTRRRGQQLATQGDRDAKIASCVDCHGPEDGPAQDDYPRLAGQPVWYLEQQLQLFTSRVRGGSPNASLMHPIADKLDASQRKALATFYAAAEFVD